MIMKGKIVSLVTLAGEYIGKYMHENNGNDVINRRHTQDEGMRQKFVFISW